MTHIFTRRASGLFAPDTEPLVTAAPSIGLRASVIATLRHAKSGTSIRSWRFHNLLTRTLLNDLMINTMAYPGVGLSETTNYFAAGTATTVPTRNDTLLPGEIAAGGRVASASSGAYVAGPPDYCFLERSATFSTAQANGDIGEFGWFDSAAGGRLWARAVPKDLTGAQITILKDNTQTLDLSWYIFMQYIQEDMIAARTIGGVDYTITGRAIGANAANPASYYTIGRAPNWNALGARTQAALAARTASSAAGAGVAQTVAPYVNDTWQRTVIFTAPASMTAMAFLTNCGGNSTDFYATMQLGFAPALAGGQQVSVVVSLAPV